MVALRTGMRHRFRHSVYLQMQLLKMQEHRLTATGVDRRTRVRRIATESSRSEEAATVLYTQVSYAYRTLHLRHEHGWARERATASVINLAIDGVSL